MHQFLSEFPPPPTTKVPIGVLHVMNAAAPNTIFVMFPKSSFINVSPVSPLNPYGLEFDVTPNFA